MKKNVFCLMIAVLAILSACSSTNSLPDDEVYGSTKKNSEQNLIPFSRDVVDAFPDQFPRLQVYTGQDIVLYRYITVQKGEIVDGKIITADSTYLDKVTINAGQLGEIISPSAEKDRFRVSFREGDNEHYLFFGYAPNDPVNCLLLTLNEKDKKGNMIGYVYYGKIKYWVGSTGDLLCNAKQLTYFEEHNYVEKGRKIKK
jgi:hypothetical protein